MGTGVLRINPPVPETRIRLALCIRAPGRTGPGRGGVSAHGVLPLLRVSGERPDSPTRTEQAVRDAHRTADTEKTRPGPLFKSSGLHAMSILLFLLSRHHSRPSNRFGKLWERRRPALLRTWRSQNPPTFGAGADNNTAPLENCLTVPQKEKPGATDGPAVPPKGRETACLHKTCAQGVPVVAQGKPIRLGTMRLRVRSLALLRGLRIQRCREQWGRSQTRLGSGVAVAVAVVQAGGDSADSTPSLGTSMCCGCGLQKKDKTKPNPVDKCSQQHLPKSPNGGTAHLPSNIRRTGEAIRPQHHHSERGKCRSRLLHGWAMHESMTLTQRGQPAKDTYCVMP